MPDESIGFWIYRIYSQANSLLRRAFEANGNSLTPEQWGILARLSEQEGMNQSQLGERAFKDRHNITRLLNVLERRGLVERRPDESDRRAYRLFLTEAGRVEEMSHRGIVKTHREALFDGLSTEDVAIMRRIFMHIVHNLDERDRRNGKK